MPHFSFIGPLVNPLNCRSTMKALMPEGSRCCLLAGVGPGEDQEVVGDIRQRNPRLLAGQDVPVAFPDGGRLDRARIAAGARFGERVPGNLPSLCLRHEVPLFLGLGAPGEQRQAVEPRVHRQDDAERRVHVLQLLAGQAEADVIEPRAAVLLGHAHAQEAELRHAAENAVPVELVIAVELRGSAGPPPERAHSRTDCSTRRCSSVRSKPLMRACGTGSPAGCSATGTSRTRAASGTGG